METNPSTPIIQTGSLNTINWSKVLIATAGLAIFGGLCAYVGHEIPVRQNYTPLLNNSVSSNNTHTSTGMTTTPTVSPTVTTSTLYSGWNTYTNANLGLTFKYPTSFTQLSTAGIPNVVKNGNGTLSNIVVAINDNKSGYDDTTAQYTQSSYFSISSSQDTSKCYMNPSDNTPLTTQVKVNGTTYYTSNIGGGAAGTDVFGTMYRAIAQNQCFSIIPEVVTTTGSGQGLDASRVQSGINQLQQNMNNILNTLSWSK